jgi:hypothetical protein
MIWQQTANKVQKELGILTDQYRQLAKINQALRDVDKVKHSKKGK